MGHLQRIAQLVGTALNWALDLLSPWVCPLCGSPTDDVLCEDCRGEIIPILPPLCPCCGLPYPRGVPEHLCRACKDKEYPFLRHRSFGIYEGKLRDAIQKLKYRGERSLAQPLGEMLLSAYRLMDAEADLVIPIPLSRGRLLERGFNQSLLLARYLCKKTGMPLRGELLVKVKETPPQVSLTASQRKENPKGAFSVRDPGALKGKRVLLVDDVFTTGATIGEASKALLRAGAKEVLAVTVARSL